MRLFKRKQAAPPWRTGPNSTFTRASTAMLNGVQFASGVPRIDGGKILVEEGTTNLLPAGAENFVTGWQASGVGQLAVITVTPNQPDPWGGNSAYRIQSSGGDRVYKYVFSLGTVTGDRTISVWGKVLSGNAKLSNNSVATTPFTTEWSRLSVSRTTTALYHTFEFDTALTTDSLDVLVCFPMLEAKPYATSYTPPGTTRAAESLAIPVGAYQKNLLTANQATGGDTLGNTTGFSATGSATVTRDTSEAHQGTGSVKVVTNNVAATEGVTVSVACVSGKLYSDSVYIKGSGNVRLRAYGIASGIVSSEPIELTSTFTRYTLPSVPVKANETITLYVVTTTKQAATFYIDGLQLEEGTTASDWALPEVDYSNALIDPSQPFSIEFDAVPISDDKSAVSNLFGIGIYSPLQYVGVRINASGKYEAISHGSATATTITSTVDCVAGVKRRHKISVDTTTNLIIYTIDGVDINSGTYRGLPSLVGLSLWLGANFLSLGPRNAYISNVRIRKGVALTAAERAYTGTLRADSYTTFFRKFWR